MVFKNEMFVRRAHLQIAIICLGLVFSGCTSKRSARQNAQVAFLAGQNAVLQKQAQPLGVTVIGPVLNSQIPWVAGLTLAQAIATANYQDSHDPKEIIITRNGQTATINPKNLLDGRDVPLELGDVIELRP